MYGIVLYIKKYAVFDHNDNIVWFYFQKHKRVHTFSYYNNLSV